MRTPPIVRPGSLLLLFLFVVVCLVAVQQFSSTWVLLGAHPSVMSQLEESLDELKALAAAEPELAGHYREVFDQRQELLKRLRILDLTRDRLARRLLGFVLVLLAVLALGGSLVRYLERKRQAQRLNRLRDALEQLARGVAGVKVDDQGADAIGNIAGMIEDASETVTRERQRLAQLEQLSAWREGARRLGHEMRTPLTAMQLDLQRLADCSGKNHETRAISQRLSRDFRSLQGFLDRITASAKLPAPRLEPVDPVALVRDFLHAFDGAWPGLTLLVTDSHASLSGADLTIAGDKDLLRQVLVNLISNSHQAMKASGQCSGTVTFRFEADRSWVRIESRDDGPGVPRKLRDTLFQPYATSRHSESQVTLQSCTAERQPSTQRLGLGLAISRMIVLQHGGTLSYQETPVGQGAIFRIELPLVPVERHASTRPERIALS